MSDLSPSDFAAFYTAVHGFEPFPWQSKLAELVFARGWPSALDVPTGAGKTSAIDIAIFHLALQAKAEKRAAPLRIAFVVDRRLVVDDAYRHAQRVASALCAADDRGIVGRAKRALLSFAVRHPGEVPKPLAIVRLRGGTPQDPDWARTPAQPTVIVSTVDQVGSRLFFRGYGVSDSMKPVHAGLLGADTLYLLDEAHLSMPFVTTVRDSLGRDARVGSQDRRFLEPLDVVTLSATQTEAAPALMSVADDEHSVLGPRLAASKPARLVSVKGAADENAFANALAEQALAVSALGKGTAQTTAVVVNRVGRARAVFERLQTRMAASSEGSQEPSRVALLIGRARPLDRERLLGTGDDGGLLSRMKSGRREGAAPVIVVATQCIEAGADLDFDALVTEIAPLDCLVQRFGRLNRTARLIEACAVIAAASDQIAARGADDPIYGEAPSRTWKLLQQVARKGERSRDSIVDFGVNASKLWKPAHSDLGPYLAPREAAPVLLPAFIQAWACTSPVPAHDPEVALFLHGPRSGPAGVQIVWRADLKRGRTKEDWVDRLAACPPSSLEAMSVPFFEARRWLAHTAEADIADVEGADPSDESRFRQKGRTRAALRWCGPEGSELVRRPGQLRPGDTLVVSAQEGGCDAWGWNPVSQEAVPDLGAEANRQHRGRDILRLSEELLHGESVNTVGLAALLDDLRDERDRTACARLVDFLRDDAVWGKWRRARLYRDGSGRPIALERRLESSTEASGEATTETDAGSAGRRAVLLEDHSKGVGKLAEVFALRAGVPMRIADDIALAAFLHDAGKARVEFKLWLYDGDEIAATAGPALAKSGRLKLALRARRAAGLPAGARHEIASLALSANHPALTTSHDRALVLWLVGTHHGHGRPFFPAIQWPPAGSTFEVDLGDDHGRVSSAATLPLAELTARWSEMRSSLLQRYGPWGLARFEAILRLADHRRSQAEQAEDEEAEAHD